MSCDRYRDLIVEALYGEIGEAGSDALEAHVAGCPSCAALLDEMRGTIARMNERRRPDPGEKYWSTYYARLEERMERERSVEDGARIAARRRSNVSWGYRVAAAVAVLAAGVWIGRSTMTRPPGPAGPSAVASRTDSLPHAAGERDHLADLGAGSRGAMDGATAPPRGARGDGASVQLAAADVRAREYIERSQVLLLALVNASADTTRSGEVDFEAQRRRAGMLVTEASALREDLSGRDNRRLRELVGDLQMILREIANLESRSDLGAVQIIRNRVDREGVLLQIDVQQMREDDSGSGRRTHDNGAIDG
jgi:hypothetical protein